MRLFLSAVAVLASLSPAYAQDNRTLSGVFTDNGKISVYKLTIFAEPLYGTEAYLLVQSPGIETCYVSFTVAVNTPAQTVLMGLPGTHPENMGGNVNFPTCASVGWVAGEKLSLMLHGEQSMMDVVVDGAVIHSVEVTKG